MAIHPQPTDFAPPRSPPRMKWWQHALVYAVVFASGWAVAEQSYGSATPGGDSCAAAFETAVEAIHVLGNLVIALETGDQQALASGDAELDRLNAELATDRNIQTCRGVSR